MTKKEGTSNAEPLTYEVHVMPNLSNERGRLAREAATLGKTELVERAAAVGIATGGSKDEIAQRVREVARSETANS